MTAPLRSAVQRWRVTRIHPLTRSGYDMVLDGVNRGSNGRTGVGLAMIAAGWMLKRRQRPAERIYQAELDVGEAIAIRVVREGEVVSETVVEEVE